MKAAQEPGILPQTNTAHNRSVLSSEGEHSFSLAPVLSVPLRSGVAVRRCAPAVDQGKGRKHGRWGGEGERGEDPAVLDHRSAALTLQQPAALSFLGRSFGRG